MHDLNPFLPTFSNIHPQHDFTSPRLSIRWLKNALLFFFSSVILSIGLLVNPIIMLTRTADISEQVVRLACGMIYLVTLTLYEAISAKREDPVCLKV